MSLIAAWMRILEVDLYDGTSLETNAWMMGLINVAQEEGVNLPDPLFVNDLDFESSLGNTFPDSPASRSASLGLRLEVVGP